MSDPPHIAAVVEQKQDPRCGCAAVPSHGAGPDFAALIDDLRAKNQLLADLRAKDETLADLHRRYLTLSDGTITALALRPIWEDSILTRDRLLRKDRELRRLAWHYRAPADIRCVLRDIATFLLATLLDLDETLRRSGLDVIEVGQIFDPRTMHVVKRLGEPTAGEPGKWLVVETARPGFRNKDTVIRRADVMVLWRSTATRAPETQEE